MYEINFKRQHRRIVTETGLSPVQLDYLVNKERLEERDWENEYVGNMLLSFRHVLGI